MKDAQAVRAWALNDLGSLDYMREAPCSARFDAVVGRMGQFSENGPQRFSIEATMSELGSSLGVWGLFLSAFVSSTIAPGGSEAVLAYLVHSGNYDAGVLLTSATIGNTLGAITTWLLGYWAAKRYGIERVKDPKKLQAITSVRRWGWPILLLSWLPVVGDGFCFGAGWLRMGFVMSVAAIAAGKLARYAAIIYWFGV